MFYLPIPCHKTMGLVELPEDGEDIAKHSKLVKSNIKVWNILNNYMIPFNM